MTENSATAISQQGFFDFTDNLVSTLEKDEVLLAHLASEATDFVRFNHGQVRQAGNVVQASVSLRLLRGSRHAEASITLSGDTTADGGRARAALTQLRELLGSTPEDPYLLYSTEINSSEHVENVMLPVAEEILETIEIGARNTDLVGIWASGIIERGFANSLGQRNWHSTGNFNFDYSIYTREDKAVKGAYAGKRWSANELLAQLEASKRRAEILNTPAKTIAPGSYRVYLSPASLWEIFSILAWQAFSAEEQQAKRSSLMRAVEHRAALDSAVTVRENIAGGVGANFDPFGFIIPDTTTLFENGRYASAMVSARSSKQFGLTRNCGSRESPSSLEMDGGTLDDKQVLAELGTGIYVSNLWYLNYSDRSACRLTGMTRFATTWVEDGVELAPLNVMRFDESFYKMFGENLIALTSERQLLLDPGSYGQRSTESALLPGALIDSVPFTL